jgi:dolichol-phosphate mannosyltransferase
MKRRQIPRHVVKEYKSKHSEYCICIPVINEGERIKNQLNRMLALSKEIDVIILDGGSSDDSLKDNFLKKMNVRSLLVKTDKGKLSAQLRMGYSYALDEGYKGVITIDGNDKDSVDNIPDFIKYLKQGYDYVQGSRFVKGGKAINTPVVRYFAIKFIHAPFVSLISHYRYTDTTNGFRGYSKKLLMSKDLAIFRDIFDTYQLLPYIAYRAARMGYRITEIPVERKYPKSGGVPTKLNHAGHLSLLRDLFAIGLSKYNPKKDE